MSSSAALRPTGPVFLFVLCAAIFAISVPRASAEGLPEAMRQALDSFRAEGAYGWAFEQSSRSDGEEIVEGYNPAKPEGLRWTLLAKNGRQPTQSETENYARTKALRSSAWNAPRLETQLDRSSCLLVSSDKGKLVCSFRLNAADEADVAAEHLLVTCTADVATKTVERVEIRNREPFSPAFGISIAHSRTVLLYSLPSGERPSLLLRASMEVKGRMFWLKSVDQKMEIVWGKFAYAGARR